MRKKHILTFLACLFGIGGMAQQRTYFQQQVNFNIKASLDDSKNTLTGFETVEYINHSPDTLHFIWFHLWPNAYKNDKTAFSEQMLQLGNNSFYFSNNNEKGYINRLDFKADGLTANTEDHPLHIDIVKLLLPKPLAPGAQVIITTPFFVKLPYNFSRGGHFEQSYQLTQWYPKPALYDAKGWHEMPYLDQGEFFSNFGNYEVELTLPQNYVVAATGDLQEAAEKEWMKQRTQPVTIEKPKTQQKDIFAKKNTNDVPPTAASVKTLHYKAENVTDFAWFADKRFLVKYDTIQLTGRTIEAWNYVLPKRRKLWTNSMRFTKDAVHFYSNELAPYPYPQVSVVCAPDENGYDGMEYPMINLSSLTDNNEMELDILLAHEIGHNWLQAIIASNERRHPWMDEGMNTYYERKYTNQKYGNAAEPNSFIAKKLPQNEAELLLNSLIADHKDQPIETTSEDFTFQNYAAVAYTKAGIWMEKLEARIGKEKMRELMKTYYDRWSFKHPYPEDFLKLVKEKTDQPVDDLFQILQKEGWPTLPAPKKQVKPTALFNLRDTDKKSYISFLPSVGFNKYDGTELGLVIHNYNLPKNQLKFIATPMIGLKSKKPVGYARIGYTFYPKGKLQELEISANAARFNTDDALDKNYGTITRGFTKIVPAIYAEWKTSRATSTLHKWIDIRSYIINENSFEFERRQAPQDTLEFYALKGPNKTTVINQVSYGWRNERSLYPWELQATVQQVNELLRTTITGKYFLNYGRKNTGVQVRFFAGKIFYTTEKTDKIRFENSRYHFSMYGPNGDDDYTYSNPFIDRNQSTAMPGRQVMMRDGNFKYRSDYSSIKPGRSDNWMATLNFTFDIPGKVNPLAILPFKIPLKVFADIGTHSGAWIENSNEPRLLYSIGLQLPLFKYINLYYVLIDSKQFNEPNSLNGTKWWQKNFTFSVDVQHIKPKLAGLPLH